MTKSLKISLDVREDLWLKIDANLHQILNCELEYTLSNHLWVDLCRDFRDIINQDSGVINDPIYEELEFDP